MDDLFDNDDGVLPRPTMRGSANLDVQDYARPDGFSSSMLDDELQEDTPSRPGDGAASAPDVTGTSDWDFLDVDEDGPGMKQTDFGAHPWPPGTGTGYRPYAMQTTDLSGTQDAAATAPAPHKDSMHMEPEVVNAVADEVVRRARADQQENQMPSNAAVDPETIYDRTSYEYDGDMNVAGSGIFDMPEGVEYRPRDGIFAHDYALPNYIAGEREVDVQQSDMWDTVANNWRVVQPSAGGVTLSKRVRAYSPFIAGGRGPVDMRPDRTGPASHIEAFGRTAAKAVVAEAQAYDPKNRSLFLQRALDSLGSGMATRAKAAADKLIELGYPAASALEDTVAHCIMHAAVKDLTSSRSKASMLPRLDRMASIVRRENRVLRSAAAQHIVPLTKNGTALRGDLGAFVGSRAGLGAAEVSGERAAEEVARAPGLLRPRNLVIAGAVGVGAWLVWKNRKKLAKNFKKLVG